MGLRIFVGAPFSAFLRGKSIDKKFRRFIEKIHGALRAQGHEVRSAHAREVWGKSLMHPHECTAIDMQEIRECDVFVALPGTPASGGVHIELGWASALNKPILACIEKGAQYSPLVQGLPVIGAAKLIKYENEEELIEKITAELKENENNCPVTEIVQAIRE